MPKGLTDEQIIARLSHAVGQASGLSDSKLARERLKVRKYYEGLLPDRVSQGDSSYVSRDVWDGVESMRAQLLEVVSASHRPLTFLPAPGEPESAGQDRAEWCHQVLFTRNPGFAVLQTAIDDGLMGRVGVVKVYWKSEFKTETYDLAETTFEELQAHMADNPDAEIEDYTLGEGDTTIKRVRLSIKKDRSRVVVENLPPEEFFISPMAKDIETAEVCGHRRRMTISELLKAGYPKAKIEELQGDDKAWEGTDGDAWHRFEVTDNTLSEDDLGDGSKSRRRCMIVEAYAELDVDGSDISRLHKVTYCGSTLLDKEPVERAPFAAFVPLPRSHAFYGTSYAELLIETQKARTYLTRSIINHALITTNPRLMVVRGAVANPRELSENRIGGIVNVKQADGVMPLPQASLNPFIYQTIQMLDADKEEVTGISALSQGLSKDAISSQNSQGMIENLINISQTRQQIISRNFCERFLRHLYTLIYRLSIENESSQQMMRLAGAWQPVDFTSWPEEAEVEVSMTLGNNEQQKDAQRWLGIDTIMSQDPGRALFYPKEKRYNVLSNAMRAAGIRDIQNYMLSPQEVQPPPPDPLRQAEIAMKQADADVKRASIQTTQMAAQLKLQEHQAHAHNADAKLALGAKKEQDHTDLAHLEFQHKVAVDAAEMRLQVEALKQQKLTASAEPKG